MKQLLHAYRFVNLLSIDIAAGAVVGAALFARILQVTLLPQAYIVLALTVWIIYTADHLLDAWRLNGPASTDRHRLHQRNFGLLFTLLVIAGIVDFIAALFIRKQVMIPGLIMAVACGVYLVANRWLRYAKELMATFLYSCGVLLPSLSLNRDLDYAQWMLIGQFVLLVAINMLLFARMSYESDVRDQQSSFVTSAGLRVTAWVIATLFVLFAMMVIFPAGGLYITEKSTMLGMGLVLLLIFLFPRYFALEERYRPVGDAVFLLPVFVLAFG